MWEYVCWATAGVCNAKYLHEKLDKTRFFLAVRVVISPTNKKNITLGPPRNSDTRNLISYLGNKAIQAWPI